jgi:hypothetical protein
MEHLDVVADEIIGIEGEYPPDAVGVHRCDKAIALRVAHNPTGSPTTKAVN